ncbi:hypothetical protein E0493_09555 [Roseomonas sp. M0104]|uniref:DUF3617 family protein n=1 Tax=Teichococcus coralli TaxID=2545983 RepID=A0A845BE84_9PROT|nr:hypothetical protein [Pseudoroseomonas coralli]MXP63592.1 hypothetical protein [Pseudoroseomonas coralli]
MPAAPRLRLALLLSAAAFPALAQDEGWTRFLPKLAPAMVACLQGEAGSAASAALPMNHGRALVRLERADGERLECIAELAPPGQPARRESLKPLGAAPPLPGEDERRFTLERPCAAARQVSDAAGRELGWLSAPGCR